MRASVGDGVLNGLHAGFAVRRHTGGIEFDPDDVRLQTAQRRLVIRLKKQCHVRLEEAHRHWRHEWTHDSAQAALGCPRAGQGSA